MANYYEILGVSSNAGILEIKAAFRQLAKMYHPDLNPEGIEHFNKILRAYETLSDPALKSTYDYKLQYQQAQTETQSRQRATTKTWKFDERELKRRQYYNDYIKKYAKESPQTANEPEIKSSYNEFKYILFATPLAVLIFLLIMNLASRDRSELQQTAPVRPINAPLLTKTSSDLKMGDVPYENIFGAGKFDPNSKEKIHILNLTGLDVVVCLYSGKDFVRSLFIENKLSAEITRLPKKSLLIQYYSGNYFDFSRSLEKAKIKGSFTNEQGFFKSLSDQKIDALSEVTLLPGTNKDFAQTDEIEFFKNAKH